MTTIERQFVPADADLVFGVITDLADLPAWNAAMTRVVELPERMVPGAEWVVEFRALGQTWRSRSRLVDLDPLTRRFRYRSRTDDGNPSYADWSWTVRPRGRGSEVTVTCDLHPHTFWRRVLLRWVRSAQLKHTELPTSLAALGLHATTRASEVGQGD